MNFASGKGPGIQGQKAVAGSVSGHQKASWLVMGLLPDVIIIPALLMWAG